MNVKQSMAKRIATRFTMAAAVLLAASACDRDSNSNDAPANEPGVGEQTEEAAAAAGEALEDAGEPVAQSIEESVEAVGDLVEKELDQFDALGLTARNILDDEVRTRSGVVAARIDDLLFTADAQPAMAVLREGGLFGIGEDDVVVTIQRLRIQQDSAGEISIEVTLSDEELESLGDGVAYLPTDFSVAGSIETSLLSARKLLDTAVYNIAGEKVADTYDLILAPEWRIDRIVLSTGGVADVGDRLVAADWNKFNLSDDESALLISEDVLDFDALPAFNYEELVAE